MPEPRADAESTPRTAAAEAELSERLVDVALHRSVAFSTATNYVGQFAPLAIAFVLTPFILGQVGSSAYGLWILIGSIVGYGVILDLGVSSAVVKYVAEHRATRMPAEGRAIVATAFSLYCVLGAVVAALGAAFAPFAGELFGVSPEHHDTAFWLTICLSAEMGVAIPLGTAASVLRGLQRFDVVNLMAVVRAIIGAAAIIAVVALGGGIVAVALANLAATLLTQLASVVVLRRLAPDVALSWRGASTALLRRVLSFSWAVSVIQISGRLQTRTDPLVVGSFEPIRSVAAFSFAQRLAEIVFMAVSQFTKVLLPVATDVAARRDPSSLRSLFLASQRVTLLLAVPLVLILSIFGGSILEAWVGREYEQYGSIVLLLALSFMFDVLTLPAASVLVGLERHRPLARMAIANGIANVLLSIALVGPFGLTGVAIGTLVPTVAESVLLVIPYSLRVLEIRPFEFVRAALAPHVVPAIGCASLLWATTRVFDPTSVAGLAAATIGACTVYGALYFRFFAEDHERRFLAAGASAVRRFFAGRLPRRR